MTLAIILRTLKGMLLALFGEKLIAKITFSCLTWLAEQSETNIDDEIIKEWKDVYYGRDVPNARKGG